MKKDIEFLKGEVSRLRAEQVIFDNSPLKKLSIEKDMEEALNTIEMLEKISNDTSPKKIDGSNITNTPDTSSEVNTVEYSTPEPATDKNKKPTDGISLRHFAFAVSIIIFAAACIVAINHYLGIQL